MLDLVGLPQDVLALIMSFIPSKEDLRCVYLTCKALYSVAIVPLYRHMLLRARSNSMQLMAALNSENVGLRHIRHVTIDVADAARPHLNNCIVLLANLLPRDILLTLTLDCNDPLAKDSLQTLWQRQRNLRTRRIDQAAFPLSSTCDGSFRNITTLQMVISNVDTAKACSHIMQQTPGLQVLEIRADPNGYSKEALNIELEDTVAASKDIIHWVFHELAPDKQIRLRALTIYELDFETAASRLIEAVDMTGLDSLGLQNCYNIVNLLRSISAAGAPLRMAMHSLTIVGRLEEAEGRNDDAIDDFLGSFTGLKCLVIAASAQEALRPKLESLSKHAASLEVLYLDCVWNQLSGSLLDEHYNALELRRFLQRCDRLEQLVLNPPEMIFDDLPRHVNFETKDFAAGYHIALADAPALLTCGLVTRIPDDSSFTGAPSMLKQFRENHATIYLAQMPRVKALGIEFGKDTPEPIGGDRDGIAQVCLSPSYYVRGRTIDPYGTSSFLAIEMGLEEVRDIEPVSQVLELRPYSPKLLRLGYTL